MKGHYAWRILALCFFAILAAQGVRLSFGAFVRPWEHEFHASRGTVTLIGSLSFLVYGFSQPFVGRVVDHHGIRRTLATSTLLVAVGLALSAAAPSVWTLAIAYGIVASVGFGGASGVAASVAVTYWFTERRGLAFALVEAGFGAGQLLLVPVALVAVSAAGWRATLLGGAVLLAVGVAPVLARFLRDRPEDLGLEPIGGSLASEAAAAGAHAGPSPGDPAAPAAGGAAGPGPGDPAAAAARDLAAGRRGGPEVTDAPAGIAAPGDPAPLATSAPAAHAGTVVGFGGLMRSRAFWGLGIPFFVCGITTTGFVDTHLIPLAQDRGISSATAGAAVAILAAANVTGILASGPLADRVDNRRLLAALYGTRGLSFVALTLLVDARALLGFALLFGLVDFSVVAPTQWLAARFVEPRTVGLAFGCLNAVHQLGSAVGAWLPGVVYDATGSYDAVLSGAVVVLTLASLTCLTLPRPSRPGVPAGVVTA